MPNGGPDCCGNCSHNKAVQKMAHPQPERTEEFWKISHCTLRDVNILNPFWTYCSNFIYGKNSEERNLSDKIIGFINASGLYEGYVRIPWNDTNEPVLPVPVTCSICERMTDDGIEIQHESQLYGFCTNRHYVEWWISIHKDERYNPESYESPEKKYPGLLDENILDEISDKVTRGITKKSFITAMRQKLTVDDLIKTIENTLAEKGKLTDESRAVLQKLKDRAFYELKRRNLKSHEK